MPPRSSLQLPICIDARMRKGEGTGVSTYASNLVDAVRPIGGKLYSLTASHETDGFCARWLGALSLGGQRVRALSQAEDGDRILVGRDVFRRAHVRFGVSGRLLALESQLPPGIMHWTYPVPIYMAGWSNIYTVHDAIPLSRPDLTPISARRHHAVLTAIMARAHRLVTVSEAAREEIIRTMGCDPGLVVNCGQSVDVSRDTPGPPPADLTPDGYFLFCGSIEPRKNLSALLAAYRASGVSLPFVLVGPRGWRSASIFRQIADTPGAVWLPYQRRSDLLGLMAGARALLFPSLAEGFGLPVAEAMALGVAVLTSNRGALAEIAGDAALLVDPESPTELASACARLARDDALVAQLALRGRDRSASFSRQAFTDKLLGVYKVAFAARAVADHQHGLQDN